MNIKIKIEGLESIDMTGSVLKAARAAVSDAGKRAKAETSRLLSRHWNVAKKDISQALTVKATGSNRTPEQTLNIRGGSINLTKFGAVQVMGRVKASRDSKTGLLKQTRANANKGPQPIGVTVEIEKGKRTLLRKAFLRNTRNFAGRAKGGALLYGEASSARVLMRFKGTLNAARAVTIPSMFEQSKISTEVERETNRYLNERFGYHVDRLLKEKNAGPSES